MLNGKNMTKILIKHKSILVLLIGLILGAEIVHGDNLDQSVTIEPFHIFTNQSSWDAPHSGHYTVWLWKRKDSLMGIFLHLEGHDGIGPRGTIENIEFDPKSGNLSFESNVSYCLGGSYNINFRFEGSLKKNALEGVIFATDEGGNPWYRKRKKVTLKKCCDDAPLFKEYVSIEEWKKDWFRLKPCQE
jgi:hypothetical protein